jgi:hypothetical protein
LKRLMKLMVLSLVAMIAAAGCNEKEPAKVAASKAQPVKPSSVVVVPESVKGKWKAVKISAINKSTGEQKVYTVAIGSQFKLPDSNLTLTVENFLPHFVMEGTTLTSQSNELLNPAAQLRVSEGGREIYKGWLFTLYPTTHAFQHPLFSFTLAGSVPSS